jgi:glycosyltransferase involved in cell wall biosynthesis
VVWAIHESFELGVFAKLNWGDSLHPAVRARWRETLRDADVLVFEAEATRAMYAGMVPGARTKVVRYGIDLDAIERYQREHDRDALRAALGLEPDDRVVLCMGVFQERKAQLAVVHAFAQLAQAHPRAHLVLVGSHPSPYSDAVRRCVDDLGLAGAVRIVDIDPDTYRWYHVADVLLSASDVESLPRSILEAMAFGVPPLAASVFGIPEVVEDGVSGWLFRTRDGAALVAALRRVLGASEDELRTAQSAARRAAQRFDGQGYADEIGELLDRLQVASRNLSGISAGG